MGVLVGRLEQYLRGVEADVAAEIRAAHLRRQLGRLAAGVAVAVALSLSGGPGTWDLKAIIPVATGALWTQVRAIWPTVPWDLIVEHLHLPPASAAAPAGTAPGGGGDR
jgi:hypothetical protein